MKLSVVIPVYNEEESLPLLIEALDTAFAAQRDVQLELLFVNDGSRDGSLAWLRERSTRDTRVRVVSFSRNFGSHAALMAGFEWSTGDAVAFIAADLQDPPELLPRLLEQWRAGYEVVWGTRSKRDDPLMTRVFSWLYSSLMRRLTPLEIPRSGLDVCLADRKVVEALNTIREKNTSMIGLIMWAGYQQTFVEYHRPRRQRGQSKWTLAKKLKLFADSFVSFSFFPIRLVSYLGLSVSALGFVYALVVVVRRLRYGTPMEGWPSLIVSVVTLAGLQLLMLGVVAEYLWRAFDESRRRPTYIVRETLGFDEIERSEAGRQHRFPGEIERDRRALR